MKYIATVIPLLSYKDGSWWYCIGGGYYNIFIICIAIVLYYSSYKLGLIIHSAGGSYLQNYNIYIYTVQP